LSAEVIDATQARLKDLRRHDRESGVQHHPASKPSTAPLTQRKSTYAARRLSAGINLDSAVETAKYAKHSK
jgi:putative NIF3 family GTP cyclohydrolase 1 type 2